MRCSSSVPDAELGVKYGSALADGCAEDVPVEVICDPELLAWLALPRVVVKHAFDELRHFSFFDKRDAAAAPTCPCQARTQGARFTTQIDQLVELGARAVIQLIATLMTVVHELAKLGSPLIV